MTQSEVVAYIYEIYEKVGRLECRLAHVQEDLDNVTERNRQLSEELMCQQEDTERKINVAMATVTHELIEYLRYQDVQALDEEEFLSKVRGLICNAQYELFPF